MAKFRKFRLSTGREILIGKDSKTNDELVRSSDKEDVILHTASPGSPFVNAGKEPSKKEIKEASIFCAVYSREWKKKKKDIAVNIFFRKDMRKGFFSKEGSWKVKKFDTIVAKRTNIFKLEKDVKRDGSIDKS